MISRQRVVKVSQLLSNTTYRGAAQDETWIKEISSIIGCSQIAKKFMVSSIRDAQMAKIGKKRVFLKEDLIRWIKEH